MKNRIFLVAAILGLLATACKKENPQNELAVTPITIRASYGVNDGAKVSYTEDGNTITATWDAGDQLYVVYNGHLNTLTLTEGAGTTTATFTGTVVGTPTAMSVLICYVRDTNNPSAVEVSATGEYTYTSGVFLAQDGTLASAAKCNLFYGTTTYGNGSNISCTFTPNTSMMKLTVYAPDGVSAGDAATLTYKSGTTELAKATFIVGANGRNTIYLTVPAGEYTGVQTLVYQSGEANVTETLSDTQAYFAAGQTYSEIFSFGNPIIPEGAIDGKFTINSNGDQVYFSQGNLQYIGSAATPYWKFADNQWDYFGDNGQGSDASNVDRDLFGWGTSGWNNGNTYYRPWDTNKSDGSLYGPLGDYNLTGSYANSDWGYYNAISNGGNQNHQWRTLTSGEWLCVFNTRSTASGILYAKANVSNVNGVILLPDDWSASYYSLNNTNQNYANFGSNVISSTQWSTLEQHGAVFLPAAGSRLGSSVISVGSIGIYWSASCSNGDSAYVVYFGDSNLFPQGVNVRYGGQSVRLVLSAQ